MTKAKVHPELSPFKSLKGEMQSWLKTNLEMNDFIYEIIIPFLTFDSMYKCYFKMLKWKVLFKDVSKISMGYFPLLKDNSSVQQLSWKERKKKITFDISRSWWKYPWINWKHPRINCKYPWIYLKYHWIN